MKWLIRVLLAAWIMVLAGLGCSPTSDPGGGGPGPISRDTPDHLLNWLAVSYQEKDIDKYEEALHDAFIFIFTDDIAESLGLPAEKPWWGKTKDVGSTQKMFASTEVTDVNMRYESVGRWVADEEERPDTTYSVVFSRVQPEIKVTIEKPGEEAIVYWVNNSYLDINVVKDPKYPNQNLFVVLSIQEIPKDD
jgi:hypothetical protein